jgi:hypothetical protein
MIDIDVIAKLLHDKGLKSTDHNRIIDNIWDLVIDKVIDKMEELEHPEPRNKAEYDERYGLDKE